MKHQLLTGACAALLVMGTSLPADATAFKFGTVLCDKNSNGLLDPTDAPVVGALVVVTNLSGTFSNANWTTAEGMFIVELGTNADTYVDYVHPATLPVGTVGITPGSTQFSFTPEQQIVTNHFLVRNPACVDTNPPSQDWLKVGRVLCDANTNGVIDPGDSPVQGALVVVTNLSGTFSNANWTTAEGWFVVPLPSKPDWYHDYLHPDTLPSGTEAVLGCPNLFATCQFQTVVTNFFLIRNPACVTNEPPPPPPAKTNCCWLTGGGHIRGSKGKPDFTFGGVIHPKGSGDKDGGAWTVLAHKQKLLFCGQVIEIIDCGDINGGGGGGNDDDCDDGKGRDDDDDDDDDDGDDDGKGHDDDDDDDDGDDDKDRKGKGDKDGKGWKRGSSHKYIEFRGTGKLKGVAGNRSNHGTVHFVGRAEDHGEPGRESDRLYLRVYNDNGETLMLISANQNNPEAVAPTDISGGNLQIHISKCENPPSWKRR